MGLFDMFKPKTKTNKSNLEEASMKMAAQEFVNFMMLNEDPKRKEAIYTGQRPEDDSYGYSIENPICTDSISASVEYLSKLRTEDGNEIAWLRTGSVNLRKLHGEENVNVDIYELYLHGESFNKIHICPYGKDGVYTPKGLVLSDKIDEREYGGDLAKEAESYMASVDFVLSTHKVKHELEIMKQQQQEEEKRKKEEEQRQLLEKAEQVKVIYPEFDLDVELKNSLFLNFYKAGVDMKVAYEYIHKDVLATPKPIHEVFDKDAHELTEKFFYDYLMETEDMSIKPSVLSKPENELKVEAKKREMSLEQYIDFQKMMEADRAWKIEVKKQNFQGWASQAVDTKRQYPAFDLKVEYQNPLFKELLKFCDVKMAYEVIHFSELYILKQNFIEKIDLEMMGNEEVLFCRKCGSSIPVDSMFCYKCGEKVIQMTSND